MTLEDAFFDGARQVGKLTFRPFTVGSMTACKKLGLWMFTGDQPEMVPDEIEQTRQSVALAWIQTTPVPELLKAFRNGTAQDEVDAFAFGIGSAEAAAIKTEIIRMTEGIAVAAVDVVQRDAPKDPAEPGN